MNADEKRPLVFLGPLSETLTKLRDIITENADSEGIDVYEVEDLEEMNQLLPTLGQSLALISNPKKCAQVLQQNKVVYKKLGSKVIMLSPKPIPRRTLDKFMKIGLTECMIEPVNPKTLLYKVRLFLKSLTPKNAESGELKRKAGMKARSDEDIINSSKMNRMEKGVILDEDDSEITQTKSADQIDDNNMESNKKKSTYQEEAIDSYYRSDAKENSELSFEKPESNPKKSSSIHDDNIDTYYKSENKSSSTYTDEDQDDIMKAKADEGLEIDMEDEVEKIRKQTELDMMEDTERKKNTYQEENLGHMVSQLKTSTELEMEEVNEKEKNEYSDVIDDKLEGKLKKHKSAELEMEEDDTPKEKASESLSLFGEENPDMRLKESDSLEDDNSPLREKKRDESLLLVDDDDDAKEEASVDLEFDEEDLKKDMNSLEMEEDNSDEKKAQQDELEMEEEEENKKRSDLEFSEDEEKKKKNEADEIDMYMRGGAAKKEATELEMEDDSPERKKKETELEMEEDEEERKRKVQAELEMEEEKKKKGEEELDLEEDDDHGKRKVQAELEMEEDKSKKDDEEILEEDDDRFRKQEKMLDFDDDSEYGHKKGQANGEEDNSGARRDSQVEHIQTHYSNRQSIKHDENEWGKDWEAQRGEQADFVIKKEEVNEISLGGKKDLGEQTIDYEKLRKEFEELDFEKVAKKKKEYGEFSGTAEAKSIKKKVREVDGELEDMDFEDVGEEGDQEAEGNLVYEPDPVGMDVAIEVLNIYMQKDASIERVCEYISDTIKSRYQGVLSFYSFNKNLGQFQDLYMGHYVESIGKPPRKLGIKEKEGLNKVELKQLEKDYDLDKKDYENKKKEFEGEWNKYKEDKEADWKEAQIPLWSDSTFQEKELWFSFPFYDGADHLGFAIVTFENGFSEFQSKSIEVILETARGLFLNKYNQKEKEKSKSKKSESSSKQGDEENKEEKGGFLGRLFGKKAS
jgi:hypothetical protein